jgi:fused signal recognition particle receptor
MFGFKKPETPKQQVAEQANFFDKLKSGLSKTQSNIFGGIGDLLQGKKNIDAAFLDDLEERLLVADLGIHATTKIIDVLHSSIKRNEISNQAQLRQTLSTVMTDILDPVQKPLEIPVDAPGPFIILLTGVNGAGKTTTAGKIANHFIIQGHSVMLAAGDTFRAAAIEQLQTWGERNNVPVIAQHKGADSAAVIFDALQSARANNIDILIADTAGRLHTQGNLMDELKKIHRAVGKFDGALAIENILVLDAATGQNALSQAKLFNDAIGIDGIVLTKLDGTAKGGVIFALALDVGIPIRFIGVGEQVDDLHIFDSTAFVDALLEYQE